MDWAKMISLNCYGKCGCLEDSRELFDEMSKRDGGSWNALISAYVQNGFAVNAWCLFSEMSGEGVLPNEVTFANVLASCGVELDFDLVRQVHGSIVKYGFCGNVILESSLVDVYGKCGVMNDSRRMFDEIRNPNNVSWNVIVRRYLDIGDENEAVVMFSRMLKEDVRPLNHTFSNALVACSRLSQVKVGVQIHGVTVKLNYEQNEVVSSSLIDMPIKCGDLESDRGIFDQANPKQVAEHFIKLDPENSGAYVQLSNIFATSGDWEKSAFVRKLMKEKQVKRIPGCSWATDC